MKNIKDVQAEACDTIDALKSSSMHHSTAGVIVKSLNVIIAGVKLQLEYNKQKGSVKNIDFLE